MAHNVKWGVFVSVSLRACVLRTQRNWQEQTWLEKLRKTTNKDWTTELIKLFIQWRGPNERCIERNEIKNHYIVIAYLQTHFANIQTSASHLVWYDETIKNYVASLNESLSFSCIISNLLSSLFLQLHTSFIENWYLKQRCVFARQLYELNAIKRAKLFDIVFWSGQLT